MAGVNRTTEDSGGQAHGLRFLNDEWNNTIINGDEFTLRWNASLDLHNAELGLFRVMYPDQGVVVYQLDSNLTQYMGPQSCAWEPKSLEDELYAIWLRSGEGDTMTWTISPPWTPKKPKLRSFTWAAPFLVPICLLLFLYFTCLATCLVYRKKKKAKREREAAANRAASEAAQSSETQAEQAGILLGRDRNASVDSTVTVEMIEPPEGPTKPGVWLITARPRAASSTASEETLHSENSRAAEQRAAEQRAAQERAIADSSVRFVR